MGSKKIIQPFTGLYERSGWITVTNLHDDIDTEKRFYIKGKRQPLYVVRQFNSTPHPVYYITDPKTGYLDPHNVDGNPAAVEGFSKYEWWIGGILILVTYSDQPPDEYKEHAEAWRRLFPNVDVDGIWSRRIWSDFVWSQLNRNK